VYINIIPTVTVTPHASGFISQLQGSRQDQPHRGQEQHPNTHIPTGNPQFLNLPPESPHQTAQPKHKQEIRQHTPQQRQLHHSIKAASEGGSTDEEFGSIPKGGI